MAGCPADLLGMALMNFGLCAIVFLAILAIGALVRLFDRAMVLWSQGVSQARAGAPDDAPVDEWPLFSAAVSIAASRADPYSTEIPGLGLTMADGGEPIEGTGLPAETAPAETARILPFSIRLPGSPDRAGQDPDVTFTVRVDEAVYTVTHSALPPSLRLLSPRAALQELSDGTFRALASSGPCRVVRSGSRSVLGKPARISRFEVRPARQAPYILEAALLHIGDRALAVSYGDRARRFRRSRFTRFLSTLIVGSGL